MIPLVQQVMRQTRERIFKGNAHSKNKLLSLFEPHTEIIRKGKAAKPTEFGKMVKIQEAEQQIVTHYEVYDERPSDSDLLIPALDLHAQQFGTMPHLVAADAAFFSAKNETWAYSHGVKRVSIPNRNTRSAERKKLQKGRMVPRGAEVAHRRRRTHQPLEATPRTESMSLQRAVRYEALGGTRRHRRQPHQSRPCARNRGPGSRGVRARTRSNLQQRPVPKKPPSWRLCSFSGQHSLDLDDGAKNLFTPESSY